MAKLTPEERAVRKKKLMLRRIAFLAICVLVFAIIIVLLVTLFKAVFKKQPQTEKPAEFSQIGPTDQTTLTAFAKLYDYAAPVPENAEVADAYFTDALLVGDSRTGGMTYYGVGVTNADILASVNANISSALTYAYAFGDGTKTLEARLGEKTYSAIYLNFGLNELGWQYPDAFISAYGELIDTIKQKQPLTMIYIESILPVSANQSNSSEFFTNARIESYNALLLSLAAQKKVYFVDVASAYKDESGCLPSAYTTDGINLNKDYFDIWQKYLKTHTVSKELYTN